jgi:hypothetical protein
LADQPRPGRHGRVDGEEEDDQEVVREEVSVMEVPAAFSLFSHGENKGGPGCRLQFFCQIRKPPITIKNNTQRGNPVSYQRHSPVSSSGSGTGSGSPQCGQVSALGETALLQTLHGFSSGFSSSGTATE